MPLNLVKSVKHWMLLAIFLQLCQQCTLACQCLPGPSPPLEELRSAKMVFSGKVIANTTGKKYQFSSKFPFISQAWTKGNLTFAVQQVWKGDLTQQITTPDFSCDCCGSFKVDKEYLVYVSEGKNGYGQKILTTFCSRTTELASASKDLAVLGKGHTPKLPEKSSTLLAIGVLVSTFSLLVLLLLLIKKRSQKL